MTVATALTTLKLKPTTTVVIVDSLQNILKNLDALQSVNAKITSLTTTDATQTLSVTAAQYAKDAAVLAKWGAEDGNEVDVTGVKSANAAALAAAKPAYVSTITVSDTSANVQRHLDELQTLASSGVLRQIVQTGAAATMKITAAQFVADADALAVIKNQAYSLALSGASVSDTLGLDGQTALTSNAKIKSIDIRDTTDAIEANLDALQRVGLRLKTISQTDAGSTITLSGAQYLQDSVALGKIITGYDLAVIRAFASQTSLLTSNHKVLTVSVADTAANISRNWSLIERLAGSLTAVEVTDSANAISVTADQLALSEELLTKFTDDVDHTYKLAVTGLKAGQAAAAADLDHVTSVSVTDTADNVVANLADLEAVKDAGLLSSVTLNGKGTKLTVDAALLKGAAQATTQGILDKITNRSYTLGVTGAAVADVDDLAANSRVVTMEVDATGADLKDNLDALYTLGKRVTKLHQSDSGQAIDVTQAQFEARSSVLAKIEGGYTVNVSGVTARKALSDAANGHVATVSVADSGDQLVSAWNALRSLGGTLANVTKTDAGDLSVTISQYQAGKNDQLIAKFDAAQSFAVSGATVEQAADIGDDDAVAAISVTDDNGAVTDAIADLSDLATAGKLSSVTLNSPAQSLALHAGQLDDAQDVLDLISGGHYTLAVDEVDAADAKALMTSNAKVASMRVSGDAASIVASLSDLTDVGHKLTGIDQSDAADTALALTGATYEANKGTLAKIVGGYQADLSDVGATKAATFAASANVKSLQVADTGANLSSVWDTLGTLGSKLTDIAQSDSAAVQLTMHQWNGASGVVAKFSTDLAVSVSNASVADMAGLSSDDIVTQFQVADSAASVSGALADLASEAKLTEIQISDSATGLTMSASTYAASTDVLGLVKDGLYTVALSAVDVADVATLGADAHVGAMDVTGTAADIASSWGTLAGTSTVSAIALSDVGGTMTLSGSQVLSGTATLAKITDAFRIAATDVAMSDVADITSVAEVASVGISDTAAHVSDSFDDILSLGGSLSTLHLTDGSPVLSLAQQDWTSGASALAKIDGGYQVDLTDAAAADATTLASDATVRQISVGDTSGDVASSWSALIALYDDGAGKLTGISLTDDDPLTLTAQQQLDAAAMITALLPDEQIETAV